jgi:hypothetical protein
MLKKSSVGISVLQHNVFYSFPRVLFSHVLRGLENIKKQCFSVGIPGLHIMFYAGFFMVLFKVMFSEH